MDGASLQWKEVVALALRHRSSEVRVEGSSHLEWSMCFSNTHKVPWVCDFFVFI